jgi:hypothetical protein
MFAYSFSYFILGEAKPLLSLIFSSTDSDSLYKSKLLL